MAHDFQGDDVSSVAARPTPTEAREALSGLGADDARLAAQAVTPWWYHVALGAIVALIVCTQAAPFPAPLIALPVAIFALPALVLVYRRRYGLWFSRPAGRRSRRIYRVMVSTIVVAFAAALVVRFTDVEYGWVLVPAVLGFVACVVLGRRYDAAFRSDLAGHGRENR